MREAIEEEEAKRRAPRRRLEELEHQLRLTRLQEAATTGDVRDIADVHDAITNLSKPDREAIEKALEKGNAVGIGRRRKRPSRKREMPTLRH